MKLSPNNSFRSRRAGIFGFTLTETMFVAVIFAILIAWMVSSQILGLRIYTLAATKLTATASARKAIGKLRDQIREASTVDVGNCSSAGWSSFTLITNGNPQQGNALKIVPTTNSTPFLIAYLDTNNAPTNDLDLYDSSIASVQVLASYVTNQIIFDAENFQGNILTNNVENRVIRLTLQFYQWEYPIARVGGTNYNSYDFYQLRTRATRRAID
jgi:type II secretory pathway pseudopilin PulG